mmetsp:Transcript_6746/g.15365  ORF Transcript_6746/g.15365 Transcript_6746/m.15365 type:complete len:101 (-) Transcript_6746:892-1194(-)
MATNDDDLYGDLEDAVAKPMPSNTGQKVTHHTSTSKSLSALPMMSHPEIAQLQQQIKSLKVENDIVKKNIGILYRTSKSELERKDRTIDQLQNELDSMRR